MTTLVLYDDAHARAFEPFASTRPVSELAAGTALIRDRWRAALGVSDVCFAAGQRHEEFDEPGARAATGTIPAGSIIANTRCVPALVANAERVHRAAATCSLWRVGDRLGAVRARQAIEVAALADGSLTLEDLHAGTGAIGTLAGWWLDDVWDFVRWLPDLLAADIACVVERGTGGGAPPPHSIVLGNHAVLVADGSDASAMPAIIEPQVVFDASAGPIMVGPGSHVRAFTRLTGPCSIGRDVQVLGGDLSGCSIGDVCKVRGEMSNTVMLGHSNKGHEGFVGHSYIGRWVNLGAGTITSNLKNTYGQVTLWTPAGVRDTGMQFLGTLFGDHVKTGIGMRLTTGTVIGAGANLYGGTPPKAVAPFSWGEGPAYDAYRAEKFLEAAARMMARRHVALSDRARRHLAAVHAARWTIERDGP